MRWGWWQAGQGALDSACGSGRGAPAVGVSGARCPGSSPALAPVVHPPSPVSHLGRRCHILRGWFPGLILLNLPPQQGPQGQLTPRVLGTTRPGASPPLDYLSPTSTPQGKLSLTLGCRPVQWPGCGVRHRAECETGAAPHKPQKLQAVLGIVTCLLHPSQGLSDPEFLWGSPFLTRPDSRTHRRCEFESISRVANWPLGSAENPAILGASFRASSPWGLPSEPLSPCAGGQSRPARNTKVTKGWRC